MRAVRPILGTSSSGCDEQPGRCAAFAPLVAPVARAAPVGLAPLMGLAALVGLAACADPAVERPGPAQDVPVLPAPSLPPRVIPVDPSRSRPSLRDPEVRPPDLRDAVQIDAFVQRRAELDLLWVVDDSGSMADERQRLAAGFDRFLARLIEREAQVSYRIGVVSTQLGQGDADGRLRGPVIENGTADAQAEFARQLDFPPGRVKREQGFAAARLALARSSDGDGGPPRNPGFVREGAALAVIFVSDEDDDSPGGAGYYARWFRSFQGRGDEGLTSVSAIAGPLPDGCVPPGEEGVFGAGARAASRYAQVTRDTFGTFGSICEQDLAPTLERVVDSVRTLRRTFPLSLPPDLETLQVRVCPAGVPCDDTHLIPRDPSRTYRYDAGGQAIVFLSSAVPPPGATVRIEYALAPDGGAP